MPDLLMDRAKFQSYLRHKLPEAEKLTVTGIKKFPRGSSRETWFIECEGITPSRRKLVVRRDFLSGSVCPLPLRTEYEIYRRLGPSPVPVAEALWYEDGLDDEREFFVREHIDGTWDVPGFQNPNPEYDDVRIAVSKEHLRKMALVHTCDWEALGFGEIMPVPPSPETAALTLVDTIVAKLEEIKLESHVLVTEAAEWLRDHAPKTTPRISLCKGTNGLGEEVFRGGEIVAMCDWELACLGDPTYDFAQLQAFLPEIGSQWGLTQGLEYYEEISGIHIEPGTIDYYRVVNALHGAMFTQNAARLIADGDKLARLCWGATQVNLQFRVILAKACGLLPAKAASPS